MKVISEEWGSNSYDHIVICFHSVIPEVVFLEAWIYSTWHSKGHNRQSWLCTKKVCFGLEFILRSWEGHNFLC